LRRVTGPPRIAAETNPTGSARPASSPDFDPQALQNTRRSGRQGVGNRKPTERLVAAKSSLVNECHDGRRSDPFERSHR